MPIQLTYPGVYVEEIPSGVHTIVGVSTSDTAFIDFFARGPVNTATRITSFSDFERTFGGLDTRSEASYAIQQFYLNGGQIAWVVRVAFEDSQNADENMATASCPLPGTSPPQDTLVVHAASSGAWAGGIKNVLGRLEVAIDHNTRPANDPKLFNMVVREVKITNGKLRPVANEVYRSLSMDQTSPRYAVTVVNAASTLVQLEDKGLGDKPAATAQPTSKRPTPDVINAPLDADFLPFTGGSDGTVLDPNGTVHEPTRFFKALVGDPDKHTGMYALDRMAPFIFNILCLPAAAKFYAFDIANGSANYISVFTQAQQYCHDKRAFVIIDIPPEIDTLARMTDDAKFLGVIDGLRSPNGENAAVYFPRIQMPDLLNNNQLRNVGASGTLAGIYARTDATRGVWKAPAGTEAGLGGASLVLKLTDLENGALNPLGINALRNFPIFGNVSWGARTLQGADQEASEWKYIPVRRIALFIEESLYQGLKWAVFEPNDEPLWAQMRLNVGAFMQNLFRQGAFQGQTRRDAYFVKCDKDTTTQNDIDQGIVNVVVGFAPLKPAEFVVIQLQQMAGQVQV